MSALRPYQQDALDALFAGWARGLRRIGVSLPTGVGKTHIMAHLARLEAPNVSGRPGHVLVLVHRDTLVEQTVAKLRATVAPGTSIGVLKAERNEVGAHVIVASVHSLRSAARRAMLPRIGVCIVDEAHVSVSQTYRDVFDAIGAFTDGGADLAGFTATWSRSDSIGLGDVWQEVVYAKPIKWAVREGHLVPPRAIQVGEGVDVSGARISRATGDYREGDLEELVMLEELRDVVVRGALTHDPDRPTVLFAPTVVSAEYFGDALRAAGIATAGIYGTTSPAERRPRFADHAAGKLRVLTTCTALAEGWDAPYCSRGLLVRPTRHEGMFVQMFGRFLRPWPGKHDALLLDFVGATDDVALRNAIDLSLTQERPDGELVEADELLEDEEPTTRERMVRKIRGTHDVELFAGTQVQWLTSTVGVPFVQCGERLVFVVQGRDGWNVGSCAKRLLPGGKPDGGWVAEGLSQTDALTVASDHAEEEGEFLARRSSSWRRSPASDAQLETARRFRIPITPGIRRGELSDLLSVAFCSRTLSPFAAWSAQWRAYEEVSA